MNAGTWGTVFASKKNNQREEVCNEEKRGRLVWEQIFYLEVRTCQEEGEGRPCLVAVAGREGLRSRVGEVGQVGEVDHPCREGEGEGEDHPCQVEEGDQGVEEELS